MKTQEQQSRGQKGDTQQETSLVPFEETNAIDFVGSSQALKELFALPATQSASLVVHNVEGVLLIEQGSSNENDYGENRSMIHLEEQESGREDPTSMLPVVPYSMELAQHFPSNCSMGSSGDRSEPQPWSYGPHSILVSPPPQNVYQNTMVRVDEIETWKQMYETHQDKRLDSESKHKETYAQKVMSQVQSSLPQSESPPSPILSGNEMRETEDDDPSQQMILQTCRIPVSLPSPPSLVSPSTALLQSGHRTSPPAVSTTPIISTVLDVYLDNLLANVPQLALCLQEKGLLQTVKVLKTQDIPIMLQSQSILDTSVPFNYITFPADNQEKDQIFSPQVIDVHAHSLLSLLQRHCHKDHATYLLRQENGNLQLYDVSSISSRHRSRHWIWWLAVTSGKFAQRLEALEKSHVTDPARARVFRNRQRSLLENAIALCQELKELDDQRESSGHLHEVFMMTHWSMRLSNTFTSKNVDSLTKSSDHLQTAIQALRPFYKWRSKIPKDRVISVGGDDSEDEDDDNGISMDAIGSRLLEMQLSMIETSMNLLDIHLENFNSSSTMRLLRKIASVLAESATLLGHADAGRSGDVTRLHVELWRRCGDFARSFTTGGSWRELGHISGEDIIRTIGEVQERLTDYDREKFLVVSCTEAPSSIFPTNFQVLDVEAAERCLSGLRLVSQSDNFETFALEVLMKQQFMVQERRKVLVISCFAYEYSMRILRSNSNAGNLSEPNVEVSEEFLSLMKKYGDACNEIGKIILDELRVYVREPMQGREFKGVSSILLRLAKTWFEDGIHAFVQCADKVNEALLRCNLCQCLKLEANNIFITPDSDSKVPHAEACLSCAIDELNKAHRSLFDRDVHPTSWDMVSAELASTYLVLGVRRRQALIGTGSTPVILQALRLAPGKESSIVEPILKALRIYESMSNYHQIAATHYQLALFYSKIWACQRDEKKTHEKLASAFHHFNQGLAYFLKEVAGNEVTLCLICLDIADLYATVSGKEPLGKALDRCLDTAPAFSNDALIRECSHLSTRKGWIEKQATLATNVEERVFKYLRALTKLEEESSLDSMPYKRLYRIALQSKMEGDNHDHAVESTNDASLDDMIRRINKLCLLLNKLRTALEHEKIQKR